MTESSFSPSPGGRGLGGGIGDLMKATVDPNRCDIAGTCVVICPEVFRFHEGSKKAYVTRSEIPKNLEQKCLEAAKKCPNKAIIILRD
jgi:ferredoxin